eukprot:Em0001g826a
MHRIPVEKSRRARWIRSLRLVEKDIKAYHRVCSRHFPLDGQSDSLDLYPVGFSADVNVIPEGSSGQDSLGVRSPSEMEVPVHAVTCSVATSTVAAASSVCSSQATTNQMVSEVDEHLILDIPIDDSATNSSLSSTVSCSDTARIELLQGEILMLSRKLKTIEELKTAVFTIDCIANDDNLIRFYTGFTSYDTFVAFFEFLGPSVTQLDYWGEKDVRTIRRSRKLDPINQLFLTLMKLKLDLKYLDLSVRFGISKTLVSRYFTTWVCFLYQHLNEIQWMPSVEQVRATLPKAFHDKYETTFAIIDANVELTQVSGFLEKLDAKKGISIMADRGFTIQEQLQKIGVALNIPPFLNDCKQLPPEDVQKGRHIASLRIHIERAIGRMKKYDILQGVFPLSMPVLIAPTPHLLEAQVEEYFQALDDTESETERNDTLNI